MLERFGGKKNQGRFGLAGVTLAALALVGPIGCAGGEGGRARSPTSGRGASAERRALRDPRALESRASKAPSFELEPLLSARSVQESGVSPRGDRIAYVSAAGGKPNLWLMGLGGGAATPLVANDERQSSPVFSPSGEWVVYEQDHKGDENFDLYLVNANTREIRHLTETADASEVNAAWSPDGTKIAFLRRSKGAAAFEIVVREVASGAERALTERTPDGTNTGAPVWSPDGAKIAFVRGDLGGKHGDLFVVDTAGGGVRQLTSFGPESSPQLGDWSPDGVDLLVSVDGEGGFRQAALVEAAGGRLTWLTRDAWNKRALGFSPDGRRALFATNVDGNWDIYVHERKAGGAPRRLPLPAGVNLSTGGRQAFSAAGEFVFEHEGPTSPRDLWAYSFVEGRARPLTRSLPAGVREADLVEPSLVRYAVDGGKADIAAFVYVPHGLRRDGTSPAVVLVHGGPTAQHTNRFYPGVQYLANRGYVVIAPNFRGSSGYGRAFQFANRYDWGGGDLRDVVGASDWLAQTGFIDPRKVAIMGASYGGYMALMGVTKTPERWAAAVSIVPFVNLVTEFENEDPTLREYDRFYMGDPQQNPALWYDRSPVNFADRARAPTLLLAGGNDVRDPATEAMQMAEAMRKAGAQAELHVYPDEGHSIGRVANQVDLYRRSADFLDRHVRARR